MKLGELFIELGITGDIKPLKQALSGMDKASIKAKLLKKYLADLKKAKTEEEKATIKSNFAQKINTLNVLENIKAIGGLISAATKIVGIIGTVVVAFDRLGNSLLKSNQLFINFTNQTGMSIDRLNKLAGVAKLSGMSLGIEQVANDLTNLEQKIFRLGYMGEGSGIFAQLGMNPIGMNADQFIGALRKRIRGLSEVQKTFILDSLGLSREWLNVINLSNEEYADLLKQSKDLQLSEEERKELAKYTALQQKNNMRWELAKQRFLKATMPLIIKIMDKTSKLALKITDALGNEKVVNVLKDISIFLGAIVAQMLIFSGLIKPIFKFLGSLLGLGKGGGGLFKGLLSLFGIKTATKAGSSLFSFGAKKALVGTLGKGAAAGILKAAGLGIPFLNIALIAWTIWDIYKLVKDWFDMDKQNQEKDETSPVDDSDIGSSYRILNSNISNHFHNNPVPQQEIVENFKYLTDIILARTTR